MQHVGRVQLGAVVFHSDLQEHTCASLLPCPFPGASGCSRAQQIPQPHTSSRAVTPSLAGSHSPAWGLSSPRTPLASQPHSCDSEWGTVLWPRWLLGSSFLTVPAERRKQICPPRVTQTGRAHLLLPGKANSLETTGLAHAVTLTRPPGSVCAVGPAPCRMHPMEGTPPHRTSVGKLPLLQGKDEFIKKKRSKKAWTEQQTEHLPELSFPPANTQ